MSRSQRSEPAADSITPITCQPPGTAWQNACTRPSRVGGVRVERGEHDARRAQHDRGRAALGDDADARARPPPGRPRPPPPARRRGSPPPPRPTRARRGSHARVDLERVEHLVAPAPPARRRTAASPRRRRRRSRAARTAAAARSPWAAGSSGSARSTSGSCSRSHSSLGAVKPASARLPVSSTSRSRADALLDLVALRLRAPVVPEDRRAQRAVVVVERDEPVHLARQADAQRAVGLALLEHLARRAPPVVGVLLEPARPRRGQRVAALGDVDDRAAGVDRHALDRRGPDVEADEPASSPVRRAPRRRARRRRRASLRDCASRSARVVDAARRPRR